MGGGRFPAALDGRPLAQPEYRCQLGRFVDRLSDPGHNQRATRLDPAQQRIALLALQRLQHLQRNCHHVQATVGQPGFRQQVRGHVLAIRFGTRRCGRATSPRRCLEPEDIVNSEVKLGEVDPVGGDHQAGRLRPLGGSLRKADLKFHPVQPASVLLDNQRRAITDLADHRNQQGKLDPRVGFQVDGSHGRGHLLSAVHAKRHGAITGVVACRDTDREITARNTAGPAGIDGDVEVVTTLAFFGSRSLGPAENRPRSPAVDGDHGHSDGCQQATGQNGIPRTAHPDRSPGNSLAISGTASTSAATICGVVQPSSRAE